MTYVIQYPDLMEVSSIAYDKDTLFKTQGTEFAFNTCLCNIHQSVQDNEYGNSKRKNEQMLSAEELGFKAISVMHNWWPSHYYEADKGRPLVFYWQRLIDKVPDNHKFPIAKRKTWCYGAGRADYEFHEIDLQSSGCGFKIGVPPLSINKFARFFTLLRMPIEPHKIQLGWLKQFNFRLIDTGKLASYWINGWPIETYNYRKIELPYFKNTCKFSINQQNFARPKAKLLAKPKEEEPDAD